MTGESEDNGPWTEKTAAAFENKAHSKFLDPCQEAAARSYRCLQRNAGDKEMCQDYFQAYRDCKKQWMEERKKTKPKWGIFG